MKYVVCIPDGCADEPVAALGGLTPLESAVTPTLDALAARGSVGRAAVIPERLPPGSDVGNMSIFGYDPSLYHTGRAPIEAAAMGLSIEPDQVAFRCNLVTIRDGVMIDFAGGHPDSVVAARAIAALDEALGGDISFHAGLQYRHAVLAPDSWAAAVCTPPHDITGRPVVPPSGPTGDLLCGVIEASAEVLADFEIDATHIWLWGQGRRAEMPSFFSKFGVTGGVITAVDLVRGIGALTGMKLIEVEGATGWYDTNYEGKRDAALHELGGGLDLMIIHVEASDEAGHAGDVEEKVRSLENWDRRILADLVTGLDSIGPWRMLLLPDHATPVESGSHTSDAVPYLMVDSGFDGPGGTYSEAAAADQPVAVGHELMGRLTARG